MIYHLNQVKIIDPRSPWHRKIKNIRLENGIIKEVVVGQSPPDVEINALGMELIPGLCETYASIGEPGHEYREDIESLSAAAAAGGITSVCAIADNEPVTQHKTHVEFIRRKTEGNAVEIWPIGAVTDHLKGKNPTEMYDMHYAGAVAFSDAPNPIKDAGVMLRALQYVQPFDGVVIAVPYNASLSEEGLMNEGTVSVKLGMKGIPALAESLQIYRDLELLRYGGGSIHFTGISTADAVHQIRKAKEQGLSVTASAYLHHLLLTEEELHTFESNYKVMPPLRTSADVQELMAGLEDGTIDCISTQHIPLDTESKRLEFEYALPGMANIELAFSLANSIVGQRLGLDRLVELFSHQAREILKKSPAIIGEGLAANVALVDANEKIVAGTKWKSKSKNSPFIGQELIGSVKAIYNNAKWVGYDGKR